MRGMTLGWLFSAIIMDLIALLTMFQSLWDVAKAIKLEEETLENNEEVGNAIFCQEESEDKDVIKREKSKKKSVRLAKYLGTLALLFIFDLCFGIEPSQGAMDLLHLMYDIVLKILLGVMLFQRRPIKGARAYEVHIHTKYKPFDQTIFSGSDATRTVSKLKLMVREKTMELAKMKQMEVVSENHEYDDSLP